MIQREFFWSSIKGVISAAFLLFYFCANGQGKYEYQYRHDLTYKERVALGEAHFDKVGRGKGVGYKQFKRWKYWAEKSIDANGFVISTANAIKRVEI